MPPARKYQKEDIVNTAYYIVEKEGFQGVNARRIAKELGCSVQPIFHNFSSMEEVNKEVYKKIYDKYSEYMHRGIDNDMPYKQMGLGYIFFAKDYPEFFKVMFMNQTNLDIESYLTSDPIGDEVIKAGQSVSKLTYNEQKKLQVKVSVFTHGIACLVATKTAIFTDAEIEELLVSTVDDILQRYKNKD